MHGRELVQILSLSGLDYTTYEMENKEVEEKGEEWGKEDEEWGKEGFWLGFKDHTSDGRYKMYSGRSLEGVADHMSDGKYLEY